MTKREIEQFRLDTRAQAMSDALNNARFAERTGQTAIEALETSARIAAQAATEGPQR